jgi:hypothetical protein
LAQIDPTQLIRYVRCTSKLVVLIITAIHEGSKMLINHFPNGHGKVAESSRVEATNFAFGGSVTCRRNSTSGLETPEELVSLSFSTSHGIIMAKSQLSAFHAMESRFLCSASVLALPLLNPCIPHSVCSLMVL